MPYSLSTKGAQELNRFESDKHKQDITSSSVVWNLTDLQKKALEYAQFLPEGQDFGAAEVATYYNYPNGQYFRGVLASLHKKDLLDKKEEGDAYLNGIMKHKRLKELRANR